MVPVTWKRMSELPARAADRMIENENWTDGDWTDNGRDNARTRTILSKGSKHSDVQQTEKFITSKRYDKFALFFLPPTYQEYQ